MTDFDLATLEIFEDTEPMPKVARGNRGEREPSVFEPALKASYEKSTAFSIYVPPAELQKVLNQLDNAARRVKVERRNPDSGEFEHVEIGVQKWTDAKRDANGQIVKTTAPEGASVATYNLQKDGPHKGKVHVRFQAKDRKHQEAKPLRLASVKDADGNVTGWVVRKLGESKPVTEVYPDKSQAAQKRDEMLAAIEAAA